MCALLSSVEFWKIALPSIIAIVLAVISHQFAISRQLAEQRRKQRIEYLISSFTALMMYSNNQDKRVASEKLREASISIQFLGTSGQVEMMRTILAGLGAGETVNLDPLIFSLRDDIRRELGIEQVSGPVYWTHPTVEKLESQKQTKKAN